MLFQNNLVRIKKMALTNTEMINAIEKAGSNQNRQNNHCLYAKAAWNAFWRPKAAEEMQM